MEEGRDLDALVAEKVMGWKYYPASAGTMQPINPPYWINPDRQSLDAIEDWPPSYSTDIDAAWEVVEKLAGTFRLEYEKYSDWDCELGLGSAHAKTAPLAICLAALKAVGCEVEV